MLKKERNVLVMAAGAGVLTLAVPWIIEKGVTWDTLRGICINLGTGVLASVLVLLFSRILEETNRPVTDMEDALTTLRSGASHLRELPAQVLDQIANFADFGRTIKQHGVDAVFETRETAYSEIASSIRSATRIHIATGSLYSFWSLYRELLLQRNADTHCDLKVCLLNPASPHAASRAALDSGNRKGTDALAVYSASIRQINSELKWCRYYDFCPPSSVWLIDDVAYVTPYLYAARGGQGFCIKVRKGNGTLFDRLQASLEALIAELEETSLPEPS